MPSRPLSFSSISISILPIMSSIDGRAASFDGVVVDLSNIVGSVADLLNGLDLSIELDVNFGANDNVSMCTQLRSI